jgi:hypothetical protein
MNLTLKIAAWALCFVLAAGVAGWIFYATW